MLKGIQSISSSGFYEVKQATEVAQVLEGIQHEITVFVDIDDTIITPASLTFRKPPYNQLIDTIKKNKEQYTHYETMVSNWRLQRKVMLVDPQWPEVLEALKKKHAVYALTKMDTGRFGAIESMEIWRYQELKALSVVFSSCADMPLCLHGSSLFKGILMTGANTKSQTLSYYASHLSLKAIAVIDDKLEQLELIQQWCDAISIPFIGIVYKGLETLPGVPDAAIALFQEKYLLENAQWLEDDQAANYIKSSLG